MKNNLKEGRDFFENMFLELADEADLQLWPDGFRKSTMIFVYKVGIAFGFLLLVFLDAVFGTILINE